MLQLLRPIKTFDCCKYLFTTETQQHRCEKRNFSKEMRARLNRFKFLPRETLHIVRPNRPVADNVVVFHVEMKFTKFEIKNYLEQIYGLKIARVNTMIKLGKTVLGKDIRDGKFKKRKFRDIKVAYVMLAEGKFAYPEIDSAFFSLEQLQHHMRGVDDIKDFEKGKKDTKNTPIKATVS